MGILNATPDSFSDGGRHFHLDQAMQHARQMISEGAGIIDIGGESTRPGALPVSPEEEWQRVIPLIRSLREQWDGLISIDTSKAAIADAALEAGADIVNDVSGLTADAAMPDVCLRWEAGIVIMHAQGTPQTMQINPQYSNVVQEVRDFFLQRHEELVTMGINPEHLCFDPGIGFGKTPQHNWTLIQHLADLAILDRPILLGVSRKSLIAHRLGNNDLSLRDWPTVALTALGRERGAMIHRVHEVKRNHDALRMTEALLGC